MRFDNRARAMKPEAVMALPEGTKRLEAPTLGRAVKIPFRFGQSEGESPILCSRGYGDQALGAFVTKSIGEKFHKGGKQ